MNSYHKLISVQHQNSSILCVGLDSDLNKMPGHLKSDVKNLYEFNCSIVEATKQHACAYKMNFAFYEQYGIEGIEILKKTFDYIPKEIFTIADAKRGDIGNTSAAYARAAFEYFGADSVTVNPYMGIDSVAPFLKFKDKITFLLALTSNPGSGDFQRLNSGGKPVFRHVVEKSLEWASHECLGYVVGATHPGEIRELRQEAKDNVFLIPGVGAQGGEIAATLEANGGKPAIINVSRAIIYASDGKDFALKAGQEAENYKKAFQGAD